MNELFSKNEIASIIGGYVSLSKRGGKLWACCPFHREKTPSFCVDTSKQMYYCFGCHKGGTVIQFVRDIENFPNNIEAIKHLAHRVNMELPSEGINSQKAKEEREFRERLYACLKDAAIFFHEQLYKNKAALEYLERRKIPPSVVKRFGLGYATNSWDELHLHLKNLGYSDYELSEACLIRKSQHDNYYSFFRDRLLFPIISERGLVLGFGGRTLGKDEPKYLNTGETKVYNKSYNLYALNMLKRKQLNDIIIVEGYMDVIALHIAGIQNVVASLGTALTKPQASLIKRYTDNVFISYDGDAAGQNATLRGLDILANANLNVRVIVIPNGDDPDDFIKKYGKDEYLKLKELALPLNAYKLEFMQKKYDFSNTDDRQAYAIEACELVGSLQPVEQERYFRVISEKTGLSYETVCEQGKKQPNTQENTFVHLRNNSENGLFGQNQRDKCEYLLATCAATNKSVASWVHEHAINRIKRDDVRMVVGAIVDKYKSGIGEVSIAEILNDLSEESDVSQLFGAFSTNEVEKPKETARDCVQAIKRLDLEEELFTLSAKRDMKEISSEEYVAQYKLLMDELKKTKEH